MVTNAPPQRSVIQAVADWLLLKRVKRQAWALAAAREGLA